MARMTSMEALEKRIEKAQEKSKQGIEAVR